MALTAPRDDARNTTGVVQVLEKICNFIPDFSESSIQFKNYTFVIYSLSRKYSGHCSGDVQKEVKEPGDLQYMRAVTPYPVWSLEKKKRGRGI